MKQKYCENIREICTGERTQSEPFLKSKMLRLGFLVVTMFVLSEIALEIRARVRYGEARATYTVEHPVLGKTLIPNFTRSGSLGTLTINEHGFRGQSFSVVPQPGVVRIACLGDSVVFGGGGMMNDDQTFPAVLGQLVGASLAAKHIEVINAGVPGWTTPKVLWDFEHRVAQFSPQVVVIYAIANDITAAMRTESPKKTVTGMKSISLLSKWPKKNSVFYNAFRETTKFLRPETAGANFKEFPSSAKQKFYHDYKALVESCEKRGVTPVLVTLAQAFRPDQPRQVQLDLLGGSLWGLGLEDVYLAHQTLNDVIRTIANEKGVPLVDIAERVPGGEKYFLDAIHYSVEGQKAVAELLAESLEQSGVLRAAGGSRGI